MMALWRSVVGKLWLTILLLVAFVLFILTVLLLSFFEKYYLEKTGEQLTQQAVKVARVVAEHDEQFARSIAWTMVDDVSKLMIIIDDRHFGIEFPARHFKRDLSHFSKRCRNSCR